MLPADTPAPSMFSGGEVHFLPFGVVLTFAVLIVATCGLLRLLTRTDESSWQPRGYLATWGSSARSVGHFVAGTACSARR